MNYNNNNSNSNSNNNNDLAIQPVNPQNEIVVHIYRTFVEGFETAFVVTGTGALKADKTARRKVEEWFNPRRLMIMLITGVDVPELVFQNPQGYGDIGTTNANKQMLLHYYALSFTAYLRYNQVLRREVDRRFLPKYNDAIDLDE